jgi:hypothetical protein
MIIKGVRGFTRENGVKKIEVNSKKNDEQLIPGTCNTCNRESSFVIWELRKGSISR